MPRRHLVAVAVAVAIALVVVLWPRKHATEPPAVYGDVPEFKMTDQSGAPFASGDALRGHVWAASFMFTRCTTVCPVLTEKMKRVTDATRGDEKARFVSFSVDPGFDTPPVLAEYARAHGADTTRWSFLTGDPAPIAAAMKIGLDKVADKPPSESIIHGSHIVLVDPGMHIRGYYDSTDDGALQRLIADIGKLAREQRP